MPWKCFMIERHPDASGYWRLPDEAGWHNRHPPAGAMWWESEGVDGERPELCVQLPSQTEWNIDRGKRLHDMGVGPRLPKWSRAGEPPNVTATPSINHVGYYHGWLSNGVLTDDCEGRTYE